MGLLAYSDSPSPGEQGVLNERGVGREKEGEEFN